MATENYGSEEELVGEDGQPIQINHNKENPKAHEAFLNKQMALYNEKKGQLKKERVNSIIARKYERIQSLYGNMTLYPTINDFKQAIIDVSTKVDNEFLAKRGNILVFKENSMANFLAKATIYEMAINLSNKVDKKLIMSITSLLDAYESINNNYISSKEWKERFFSNNKNLFVVTDYFSPSILKQQQAASEFWGTVYNLVQAKNGLIMVNSPILKQGQVAQEILQYMQYNMNSRENK